MEEMNLYGGDSTELFELIDKAKVELGKENEEYNSLKNEVRNLKKKYKKIQLLFDDEKVNGLNEEECNVLQSIINLYLKMQIFEQEKIFYLGAKENYCYFKRLNIL